MPIRPENRRRYPPDWRQISDGIRFGRAGSRCECRGECGRAEHRLDPHDGRCQARHGQIAPISQSKVILTVAHLVRVTKLPVQLHVTRATETDKVVELVGGIVSLDAERLEWRQVVHDRALSEFRAGPVANSARFVVAFPSGPTSGAPGGPVVFGAAAGPVWVVLTSWRLGRPPRESTYVAAESTSATQVVSGDAIGLAAPFTDACSEAPLGAADQLTATGFRASADVIRRLLRGDRNAAGTDRAFDSAFASTWGAPDARPRDALALARQEGAAAGIGTGPARPSWIVRERFAAGGAGDMSRAATWSRHALYHIGYLPENCDPENLRAMCQGCHLAYDAEHHAATARATRAAQLADQMEPLF